MGDDVAGGPALERPVRLVVGVTPKGHREFAHLLYQLIGITAFLFANHIAQDAAQKSNVFDQGTFVFFGLLCGACGGSWFGFG